MDIEKSEQLKQQMEYIKRKIESEVDEDYQSDSEESIEDIELECKEEVDGRQLNKYQRGLHTFLLSEFTSSNSYSVKLIGNKETCGEGKAASQASQRARPKEEIKHRSDLGSMKIIRATSQEFIDPVQDRLVKTEQGQRAAAKSKAHNTLKKPTSERKFKILK